MAEENQSGLQNVKISAKRTSQGLKPVKFSRTMQDGFFGLQQESADYALSVYTGLQQEITIKSKNNLNGQAQKLTVFNPISSNDYLLNITCDGKLVANFSRDLLGNVLLKLEPNFLADFKQKNPNVALPEPDMSGSYKMAKVSFGQTGLQLEPEHQPTAEVKAASLDFKILFSALGVGIVDKSQNKGSVTAAQPFDIDVSTQFIEQALNGKTDLVLDDKEPMYSQMLVTYMQTKLLDKQKETQIFKTDNKPQVIENTFESGVSVKAVPLFVANKTEPEYLYLIVKDNKVSLYAHTTSEKGYKTVAKAHEIKEISIEKDTDGKYYLHFGLNSGKDLRNVRDEIDFQKNIANENIGIKYLLEKHKDLFKASENAVNFSQENGFDIYEVPNRQDAQIISFSNVANLIAEEAEQENVAQAQPVQPAPEPVPNQPKPELPKQKEPVQEPIINYSATPDNTYNVIVDDSQREAAHSAQTQENQNRIVDPQPPVETEQEVEQQTPSAPPAQEETAENSAAAGAPKQGVTEQGDEPKKESKEEKKEEKKEKAKKEPKTGLWIGLGFLLTALSCLVPFLVPLVYVCFTMAALPEIKNVFGLDKAAAKAKAAESKKDKDKDKDLDKDLDKNKENLKTAENEKKSEKAANKNGLTDYSLDPFNGLGANTKETPEQTVDIPFANDPTKQQLKNKQANNDKIMGKA